MAKQRRKKKKGKFTTVAVVVLALAALSGGNKEASTGTTGMPMTAVTAVKVSVSLTETPTSTPTPSPSARPTAQPTIRPTETAASETPKSQMVWVTNSGKKYHRNSSCSNMKSPKQITKTDAERQGYTPCKKCY